jgi:N-acetylglucosaminyldiphosphoundecaprenol N-acetyl-beta-D-mannosaminyltransferase
MRKFDRVEKTVNPRAFPDALAQVPMVELRGAQLAALTEQQCVQLVLNELEHRRGGWLVTMNLDHLRRFEQSREYAARVRQASLRIADGMPLIWASYLQGTPLPERVTGSDLIWSLTQGAAACGRSIFLLGGTPQASLGTASILQEQFPGLKLAGAYCPDSGFEQRPTELEQLTRAVLEAQPDIVYVALGSPRQDELIAALRSQLSHTWWLGMGISFSFVTGEVRRAPRWMQRVGLEWLHRLIQEPHRLYKRYLVQGIPFALILFADALRRRVMRRGPEV